VHRVIGRLTVFVLILTCAAIVSAADVTPIEPDAKLGRSAAVLVSGGPLVQTGQVFPTGPAVSPTPPGDQVRQVFSRLDDVLKAAKSQLAFTVKLNVYVSHPSVTELVDKELASRFAGKTPPAVCFVQTPLPDASVMVAVDAVARTDMPSPAQVTRTKPSQSGRPAITAVLPDGPQVYISGQAEKGDGTLADATKQTMASLVATLKFLELSTSDVVHVKAFLTPMSEASAAIKEIVAAFPGEIAPPISLVEWESGNPIEIELVAAAKSPSGAAPRLEFLTPPEMKSSPVFARVVRVNVPQRIYVSGLFGTHDDPNSVDEVRNLFATLQRLTSAGGSDLHHLAKATYYVSDDAPSKHLNDLRPEFYDPARPPAASKAKVLGTGRAGRTITLDMLAVPKE
jgi:enamine deaminase RidA (YjgF/YER057c/UK114 family)